MTNASRRIDAAPGGWYRDARQAGLREVCVEGMTVHNVIAFLATRLGTLGAPGRPSKEPEAT